MTKDTISQIDMARQFIDALPHCRALSMSIDTVDNGTVTMSMPYDERLIGDPSTGVIHGGAVSALMDTCAGTAVVAHPKGPAVTATLDLRIDYMRPAVPGKSITARANCYHLTRSVAFVRALAWDDTAEDPVATATGAFTAVGAK